MAWPRAWPRGPAHQDSQLWLLAAPPLLRWSELRFAFGAVGAELAVEVPLFANKRTGLVPRGEDQCLLMPSLICGLLICTCWL